VSYYYYYYYIIYVTRATFVLILRICVVIGEGGGIGSCVIRWWGDEVDISPPSII